MDKIIIVLLAIVLVIQLIILIKGKNKGEQEKIADNLSELKRENQDLRVGVIKEISEYEGELPMMFYPDGGASKRYTGMIKLPYAYGYKRRDTITGEILGLEILGAASEIAGKNILIVDDISSRGGTFYHSAKKLKELGAKNIYLYISHCENSILEGELIKSNLVKKIFTTDSILTVTHPLIEVLNYGGNENV